jgi:hypothetical protein
VLHGLGNIRGVVSKDLRRSPNIPAAITALPRTETRNHGDQLGGLDRFGTVCNAKPEPAAGRVSRGRLMSGIMEAEIKITVADGHVTSMADWREDHRGESCLQSLSARLCPGKVAHSTRTRCFRTADFGHPVT